MLPGAQLVSKWIATNGRIGRGFNGPWRTIGFARATAYDEHLAEQDRLLWEERRAEVRRRDWEQGDGLRNLTDVALPEAYQFVREERRQMQDGTVIITRAFHVTDLATVMEKASKLQRLATDQPTDDLPLSGAALDAFIASQLARLTQREKRALARRLMQMQPAMTATQAAELRRCQADPAYFLRRYCQIYDNASRELAALCPLAGAAGSIDRHPPGPVDCDPQG